MRLDVLLLSLDRFAIHFLQHAEADLDIVNQDIASATGKVFTNNNTQHLHLVSVRRHGVCGDNPSSGPKLTSQGKFVVVAVFATTFIGSSKSKSDKG